MRRTCARKYYINMYTPQQEEEEEPHRTAQPQSGGRKGGERADSSSSSSSFPPKFRLSRQRFRFEERLEVKGLICNDVLCYLRLFSESRTIRDGLLCVLCRLANYVI